MLPPMRNPSILVVASAVIAACAQPLKLTSDDSKVVLAHQLIDAPNPADRGPYTVKTLYYGSGTDKQRRYFRDSVAIKTKPTDASAFVSMTPEQASDRSEEHTSELQSPCNLVCRLLLEKKNHVALS